MNSRNPLRSVAAAAAAAALLGLAACSERADPVTIPTGPPPPAGTPVMLAALDCRAQPSTATLRCGDGALPASARGYIIVGGQHSYVELTSNNVAYNSSTHLFTFDVTVQNLIPQPMGTTDGSTADPNGVRVIFASGPTVTGGSGTATVTGNGDGTGNFTAVGQPYYLYSGALLGADGILSPNETSGSKTWSITADPSLTFSFTLYVVTEVPNPNGYVDVTPGSGNVLTGGTQGLTGTVRSAVGTPLAGQTITWGTSNGAVATVDASGTVTAVSPGSVTITATSGARTGAATLNVCPDLAVGGVYVSASSTFCVGRGALSSAEYVVTPVNLNVNDVSFSLTASGIVGVSGVPTPDRLPGGAAMRVSGPTPDDAFHMALEHRSRTLGERLRLGGALVRSGATGLRRNIVPGAPAVGTVMNLNVSQDYCSTLDIRAATVKSVGTHIILMEDNSNPSGGFSTAQYDSIAATFDTLDYPAVAGTFGAPKDIDTNGRVIALYTAAVNDLTPAGSSSYIGGFFYSRDLYSTTSCPGSNQGEMFYMLAPDPTGAHGNVRSTTFVEGVTIGTLGHEFQHLINASRRLYELATPAPFEQVWLNEGLSHIAEEEVYYASSLHGPGENISLSTITASTPQQNKFLQFAEPNFGRLRQWLLAPEGDGPFKDADHLAMRGAIWSFLRYAVDRKGGVESTFFSNLAASADTGLTNLQNRLGTDPKPWFRDWSAMMYLDDAGLGAASTYAEPSWNFRSIYGGLDYNGDTFGDGYALTPRDPSNGVAVNFTLSQGAGASYVRMGVPNGGFATVTTNAPATTALVIMRRK